MREGRLSFALFFKDIVSSVRMSRRRGILSGVMTVWGVFIFIAVVGTSNGIDKGNRSNYDYLLQFGMISIRPGEVSIPSNGLVKGSRIQLTRSDVADLEALFSARCQSICPRREFIADCESSVGKATATVSDFRKELNGILLKYIEGRGFTENELAGSGRLCVIPETVAVQLFGSARSAVGAALNIGSLPYTVLGVYNTIHNVKMWNILVPFETAMAMQGMDESLSSIDIKLLSDVPSGERYRLKRDLESWFCFKKGIATDDTSALHFEESIDFISAQEKFLASIHRYTEILGLFSLLMGILGVSSIVHLSVRERTKEIAVRLICGSSESSIFRLVLGESVMIMLLFGAAGMVLGSIAINLVNLALGVINEGSKWVFIGHMDVSWQLILSATVLVIVCGLIAGFAPARKAMSIKINEAMSCE